MYMNYEKRKEKLKSELGEVGCEELDVNLLSSELFNLYYKVSKDSISELPQLDSIYLVGSFVTNSAIKTASDIDIRFVTRTKPTEEQCEWLNEYITYNWKDYVSSQNNLFGYVDADLNHKSPKEPYMIIYTVD